MKLSCGDFHFFIYSKRKFEMGHKNNFEFFGEMFVLRSPESKQGL